MLPVMKKKITATEKLITAFKGINTRDSYQNGEITDELNMSSDMYPSLSSVPQRKYVDTEYYEFNGAGSCGELIYTYVSEGRIFLNYMGENYDFTHICDEDFSKERKFAALSDSIMIIPDNIIFVPSEKVFRKICVNKTYTSSTALKKYKTETSVSLTDTDKVDFIGQIFHDRISSVKLNYKNDGVTYDFYCFNFDDVLKSGDMVRLKISVKSDSFSDSNLYRDYRRRLLEGVLVKIRDIITVTHKSVNGSITEMTELVFDDNAIETYGYSDIMIDNITVERDVPELKNICSFNNRIWGISGYELCCSKLGDASEWNDFSTDSYGTLPNACFSTPAPVGGKFTAIMVFSNYVYAFKENSVFRLYGDSPDDFSLRTMEMCGIDSEKADTLSKTQEGMIYASYDGIYLFDGNGCTKISESIGDDIEFTKSASYGGKYYVVAKSGDDEVIYVYDTKLRLWHKEEAPAQMRFMTSTGDGVVVISDTGITYLNKSCDEAQPFSPSWRFILKFDEKLTEKRGMGKLSVRYSLGDNAFFNVRVLYPDGEKGPVCGARHDEVQDGASYVNISVKRCCGFSLEFSGKGKFCLKSLKIRYYSGSEI